MLHIVPNYYKSFSCIASACRHNCCIGWEIDIDADTDAYYSTVPAPFGNRLKQHISHKGEAHFILGSEERCPFLNEKNLCDIICTLGEAHICTICQEHPRFHNELPGRIESGLGLCCEEAARLILQQTVPMLLEADGTDPSNTDEIIALRDQVLFCLQNRTQSIPARIDAMLTLCSAQPLHADMPQWADFLLSLERLDEQWTNCLLLLKHHAANADISGFDVHMAQRQTEYEQLLVYFVYRHLANACDETDLAARASFSAFSYELLHMLGAVLWTTHGTFSFADQVELARLYSSEIEYSDENLDALLDALC